MEITAKNISMRLRLSPRLALSVMSLLSLDSLGHAQNLYVASSGTNPVLNYNGSTGASLGAFVTAGSGGLINPRGITFGPACIAAATGSGACFLGFDTTTQGSWKIFYGANGYFIANDGSMAPTYATASVGGDPTAFTYTWGAGAYLTDPRALQIGNSATGRIASEYTNYQSKSFNINVNINDGGTHPVALYMLDWDSTTRSQVVTIRDLSTGTLLDTRVISNFHNGVYASWNISGNVVITVQATGYTTPTVSGVFFNGGTRIPN